MAGMSSSSGPFSREQYEMHHAWALHIVDVAQKGQRECCGRILAVAFRPAFDILPQGGVWPTIPFLHIYD